MARYHVPYGRTQLGFELPDGFQVQAVEPLHAPAAADPGLEVRRALANPLGDVRLEDFAGCRTAAIAINDKTRPVPHRHLLPPLLAKLEQLGFALPDIRLIIATGAHPPLMSTEYSAVVPPAILARYPVSCHDCDAPENLAYVGTTGRGTPAWVNRRFLEADLRIVVGNVEPHQFQGFSGGVKSAAIGLAGRETITRNHAWMTDPGARLGAFDDNPARQDVEEIGRLIGVHFALNVVLNDGKEIVRAFAGAPDGVMQAAIPVARQVCQARVQSQFDLTIASPGGHPKDINLYQAQKALAHAALVTRPGGTVILVAACPEGSGGEDYEAWARTVENQGQVLARLQEEGFRLGPHKAFLVARDAVRLRVLVVSDMAPETVRALLLEPVSSLDAALADALGELPAVARIGILPWANATIPLLTEREGTT